MNSSWTKRLKFYGMGFLLGCVFVFFFFQTRGCSWTPSNRVKNMIMGRVITVNEVEKQIMKKYNISMDDVYKALNDGDVDFKNSRKNTTDKVYLINVDLKEKGKMKFYFTLPEESFISELHIGANDLESIENTKTGKGYFLHFPADDYLVYPDSTAVNECKLNELNMNAPVLILKNLKKNGYIDFEKSKLDIRPKPIQEIYTVVDYDTIGFSTIWYKNKIFIQQVNSNRVKDCDK